MAPKRSKAELEKDVNDARAFMDDSDNDTDQMKKDFLIPALEALIKYIDGLYKNEADVSKKMQLFKENKLYKSELKSWNGTDGSGQPATSASNTTAATPPVVSPKKTNGNKRRTLNSRKAAGKNDENESGVTLDKNSKKKSGKKTAVMLDDGEEEELTDNNDATFSSDDASKSSDDSVVSVDVPQKRKYEIMQEEINRLKKANVMLTKNAAKGRSGERAKYGEPAYSVAHQSDKKVRSGMKKAKDEESEREHKTGLANEPAL